MKQTVITLVALALGLSAPARTQDAGALVITRAASLTSRVAPAASFTGTARVQPLFDTTAMTRTYGASVAFEAGARTAWHTHPRGQILIVTAGIGRVQRWGSSIDEIRQGDVVRIPPNVKHWHGAAPASAMTHIAIVEHQGGSGVAWMEHVSDVQYSAPARTQDATVPNARAVAGDSAQPSRAQQLMGDIAPKLAQLTDSVLFGDVWARPGLSHIALARQNGVTRDEVIEAITQLAFYAGLPNAVTAVTVAREVFAESRP